MNMEASRWWLHLAKAGDLEVVVACADIAERERDRIGSSMGGRVSGRRGRRAIRRRPVVHRRVGRRGRGGGGIHRCGSLRADDCGLIDRRRAVFSSVQLGRSKVRLCAWRSSERRAGSPCLLVYRVCTASCAPEFI